MKRDWEGQREKGKERRKGRPEKEEKGRSRRRETYIIYALLGYTLMTY